MGFLSKLFGLGNDKEEEPQPASAQSTAPEQEEDDDWENMSGVPQELNAMEVEDLYRSEDPPQLLDVREAHELEADGFIPGSLHIPMGEVEARCSELEKEKPVVVYCASGMRSMDAGALLLEKGFKDVSNMAGGITVWQGPKDRPQSS